jgi:hypothetical protein
VSDFLAAAVLVAAVFCPSDNSRFDNDDLSGVCNFLPKSNEEFD